MPYVFHKYNTSMGGTDRQDQNVNTGYRYVPKSGGGLCFHGK